MKLRISGTIFVDEFGDSGEAKELGFMSSSGFRYIIGKNRNWSRLKCHLGDFVEAVGATHGREDDGEDDFKSSQLVFVIQKFFTKNQTFWNNGAELMEVDAWWKTGLPTVAAAYDIFDFIEPGPAGGPLPVSHQIRNLKPA